MKTHLKLIAGVALAAISSASAQENTTKPVGFRTETIKAGVFNLLSAELTEAISAAGTTTGVSATGLTDDAADFATTLAEEGKTWVVQVTSGARAGLVTEVTGTTATGLTTADDLAAAGVAAGDSYEVRASKTISDIFGPQNEAGLLGANDTTDSDVIWVSNGAGGFDLYYFQDNFLGKGWFSGNGVASDDVPILYTDSFFVQRKGATDINLVIVGHVQTQPATVPLIPGFNFVSRIAPVGQTLTTSGLKDFVLGANDTTDSDVIWNPNGAGGYDLYYYQDNFLGTGWFSGNGAPSDNAALQSGVIIQRRGEATNATVGVPDFYANL